MYQNPACFREDGHLHLYVLANFQLRKLYCASLQILLLFQWGKKLFSASSLWHLAERTLPCMFPEREALIKWCFILSPNGDIVSSKCFQTQNLLGTSSCTLSSRSLKYNWLEISQNRFFVGHR